MNYQKTNRNTLAAFKRGRSRMIHVSAPIKWVAVPGQPFLPHVPMVSHLGRDKHGQPLGTYNIGRNAAKRVNRFGSWERL